MRMWAGSLELEVAPGVAACEIVAFAAARGVNLPERPWCGPVRLSPSHPAGTPPLVACCELTPLPGPDARPDPGVHLAVVGGPDAGAVATLAEGLTIGRGDEAALRVADPTLSGVHAVLGDGTVRDARSRNGLRLNGRRLRRERALKPGDVLTLGETTVQVAGRAVQAKEDKRRPVASLATAAAAALSMTILAIATGHWQLAIVALVMPAFAVAPLLARRLRKAPAAAVLDITGTLDIEPLPPGNIAVLGPVGLMRAVTLSVGRPPRSAPQWEDWMELLPPAERDVTWVQSGDDVPSWTDVRVEEAGSQVRVTGHGTTTSGPLPLVGEATARASARRRAGTAAGAGIPASVRWAELPPPPRSGLPVRLGMGAHGPVVLDLVADGPHMLVAGTTGSGKSEALRTIVGSLAADFTPAEVTFALIDFKGGAGLGPCIGLPHVASVLTDLEPHLARRCLLALGAELAQRKAAAARAGATTFDEWNSGRPPRLVVVVDEFQEIAAADRDFLPQLTRLAAQGRSLGIHLVLATQRPAGAVGPEIRANVSTTVALRTASDAESRDLIGTGDAAQIDPAVPGRAMLQRGGTLIEVQVALPLADAPARIRERAAAQPLGRSLLEAAATGARAAPLWLPPLPDRIAPAPAQPTRFALGIADGASERRRMPVSWDPAAGALVVCGPPRSGRSSLLHAIGAQAQALGLRPVLVPHSPRLAVRTLALALETEEAVLLIDDAARVLTSASSADPEAIDLLTAAMVRMPTALVVPANWAHHRLVASAGLRIVLSGLAADDDAAWDVPRELRTIQSLPGRARVSLTEGWFECQLCLPGAWQPKPLVTELPAVCEAAPASALGIGGDKPRAVTIDALPVAVVGPPGPERDAVARRVEVVTGSPPRVTDSAFALGAAHSPRSVIITRPSQRSLREVVRDAPKGLVDPQPPPFRVVVVADGVPQAVQVLAA